MAGHQLHGAVGRDQPVLHGEAVPDDPCGGLDDPHAEQCQRPEPELAHPVGDARIDGLADDRGMTDWATIQIVPKVTPPMIVGNCPRATHHK